MLFTLMTGVCLVVGDRGAAVALLQALRLKRRARFTAILVEVWGYVL